MPMFYELLRKLNREFDEDRILDFAAQKEAFAPGRPLNPGLLEGAGSARTRAFQRYLGKLPGVFPEVARAAIYHALSTDPPTPVTFAWAPAKEFELTVWQPTCGVTILVKGPYPGELGVADEPVAD